MRNLDERTLSDCLAAVRIKDDEFERRARVRDADRLN